MRLKSQSSQRFKKWYLAKTELPMLLLAAIAIILYLLDLKGFWQEIGYTTVYYYLASIIDFVFVIDLLIKIQLQKFIYIKSPWFMIDFISALPIFGTYLPVSSSEGIRFVRGFRFFRVLRTLRTLRTLNFFEGFQGLTEIEESKSFRTVMLITVCLYSTIFIWITSHLDQKSADMIEFYLVIGSLLGMMVVLLVVSFMLPDISASHIKQLLNLFLPAQLVEEFFHRPKVYQEAIRAEASVIFCDIKGFTKTVEFLEGDLSLLKSNLEQALEVLTQTHAKYDLIIDKFIGDAIMSFRGGNLVNGSAEDHAYRIVKASLESQVTLTKLNNEFFNQIKIGGASSESALIGVFGTSTRMSYTILGDRVNLAARLESAVSQCGTQNLFCERTMLLTQEYSEIIWRYVGLLKIQGKQELIKAYEAFDKTTQTDWHWIELFMVALTHYQAAEFDSALEGFKAVDELLQGDELSKNYQRLCKKYSQNPPLYNSWRGEFDTHK